MTNIISILVFSNMTFMVNLPTNTTAVAVSDGRTWVTNAWPTNASSNFVGVMGTNEVRLFRTTTNATTHVQ